VLKSHEKRSEIFNRLMEITRPQEDAVPLELESLFVVLEIIPLGGLIAAIAFIREKFGYQK